MAEDLIASTGSLPEPRLLRGWRSVLFAPVGDGQRRRRGSDGVRLAAAVLALVCCVLVIHYDSRIDRAIVQVIHPPPRSITWLVTVVYDAGSFGVAIVLVAAGPGRAPLGDRARHRAERGRHGGGERDPGPGARQPAAGRPSGVVIHGYYLSFPVLQIALFMAVATAALPYLARGVQRLIEIFIALVALASAVGGHGLPVNVLGSLAIGWGTTAVVRLIFGSPLGLPSADDVQRLLAELGVRSRDLHADHAGKSGGWRSTRPPRLRPAGFPRPAPRHRRLRPGCRRCQAPHQGGPVPAVPGLRAEPHDYPAAAGRARGLPHPAGRPGGRGRARARRGGDRGTVQGRAARLPAAGRRRRCPRPTPPTSATPRLMTSTVSC